MCTAMFRMVRSFEYIPVLIFVTQYSWSVDLPQLKMCYLATLVSLIASISFIWIWWLVVWISLILFPLYLIPFFPEGLVVYCGE